MQDIKTAEQSLRFRSYAKYTTYTLLLDKGSKATQVVKKEFVGLTSA